MNIMNDRQRTCVNCMATFLAPKKECEKCGQPITSEFQSLYKEFGLSGGDIIYFGQTLAVGALIAFIAYLFAPSDGSMNKNAVVIVLPLSLLFAFLIRKEYRWKNLGKASENWIKTEGEVIISHIYISGSGTLESITFDDNDNSGADNSGNQPTFNQIIVTKYNVNGINYATGNVRFASTSLVSTTQSIKADGVVFSGYDTYGSPDLSKYPVGSKVEVYYDPNDHQESGDNLTHVRNNAVLEPGYVFSLFSWNIFGILIMPLIAIIVLLLVFT